MVTPPDPTTEAVLDFAQELLAANADAVANLLKDCKLVHAHDPIAMAQSAQKTAFVLGVMQTLEWIGRQVQVQAQVQSHPVTSTLIH